MKIKNTKLILILFIVIILGPMIFAWVLVQKGNAHQLRLSNNGDLITPPLNVDNRTLGKSLHGKWWLVYVSPKNCLETCHDVIYNMRQIRTALGKDASRVERLFIAQPDCPTSICEEYLKEYYPDMRRVKLDSKEFNSLFHPISNATEREMIGELYIIDPKGNIMMHYSSDMEAKAILSDVKRLLKVSKIG